MNVVDLLLFVVAALGLYRGFRIGLVRQLGSTLGFIGGVSLNLWATPKLLPLVNSTGNKTILSLVVLIISIGMMMLMGEIIAEKIKTKATTKWIHRVDTYFGSVMSSITSVLLVWIVLAISLLGPSSWLQETAQKSLIFRNISNRLPSPTVLLKEANRFVEQGGKTAFDGVEPSASAKYPQPNTDIFKDVIDMSSQATVKIEGFGCGGIATGSGFFITNNLVVTNAHVIAGVAHPKVVDHRGHLYNSKPVVFSPQDDLAVLRLSTPANVKPLTLDLAESAAGSPVLLPGYPGGGDFVIKTGVITEKILAAGKDIYHREPINRNVYGLQAVIVHGNSGGPVIALSGKVVGVVFATSTAYNNIGYALANEQVARDILSSPSAKAISLPSLCSQE